MQEGEKLPAALVAAQFLTEDDRSIPYSSLISHRHSRPQRQRPSGDPDSPETDSAARPTAEPAADGSGAIAPRMAATRAAPRPDGSGSVAIAPRMAVWALGLFLFGRLLWRSAVKAVTINGG